MLGDNINIFIFNVIMSIATPQLAVCTKQCELEFSES